MFPRRSRSGLLAAEFEFTKKMTDAGEYYIDRQIRGFGRLIAFSSADDVKYKCKDGKTC